MKKALCYIATIVMLLTYMVIPGDIAFAANISLGASSSSINIGDTVTVTVSVPENISGNLDLIYPTDLLEFSKASSEVGTTGSTITISIGKYGLAASTSVTVTFKAKTTGTATVEAKSVFFGDNDTAEEVTVGNASTKITIANETTSEPDSEEKSSDYYLANLKLSSGSKTITLSPAFNYKKKVYTATVDHSVSSVVVSATRSSGKAEIVSITDNGNVKLNVGANVIEIVVKAENGKTLTYQITVTRKEKPAESQQPDPSGSETPDPSEPPTDEPVTPDFTVNGVGLSVPSEIPEASVPVDFEEKTILLGGSKEVSALSFKKGELTLLYLENDNKVGGLYIYDAEQSYVHPFIKLASENGYVMVLMPDDATVPEGYTACTLSIEGKGIVNAYQYQVTRSVDPSDFYLLYGMNSQGVKGWYQYDIKEGTYQRYAGMVPSVSTPTDTEMPSDTEAVADDNNDLQDSYEQLEKELQAAKDTQRIVICVAIFVGAILAIIIINLLLAKHRENDGYEDEEEDDDYEESKAEQPSEKLKADNVDELNIPEVTVEDEEDDEVKFIDL